MIVRLLLLGLLAWFVYRLIKRYLEKPVLPGHPAHSGDMVQCAVCGVHTPHTEAISYQGKFYCCQAHFNQGQSQNAA